MDYLHAVEAVIPGARGRVLAALAENEAPQSIRQLAQRTDVCPSRASQVLEELAELGIVERYATRSQFAVRLALDNVVARWVLELPRLWRLAIDDMRAAAGSIRPVPLSLTLFGSFARGVAEASSDVDVVAVHSSDVNEDHDSEQAARWVGTLGTWSDTVGRITGNPVNLIDLALDEVRHGPVRTRVGSAKGRVGDDSRWESVKLPAWRKAASREGIVLVGSSLDELASGRKVPTSA